MKYKIIFNNFALKDKILISILMPLLFGLLFIILYQFKFYDIQHNLKLQINTYLHKKNNNINNDKYLSNIQVISKIEYNAQDLNITIENMKIKNNSYYLDVHGLYSNIIIFLNNIEQSSKLLDFDMKSDDNKTIHLNLNFKNFTILERNNNLENEISLNPFVSNRKNKTHTKILKLIAIFNEDVCINDKWYKLHSKIGKYSLEYIGKDYVTLNIKNKIIKLEMRKNDK